MSNIKTGHGGDIYSQRVILDYSVNVNPLPVPDEIKKRIAEGIDTLVHYPDPLCRELREALSRYTGIADKYCMLGNGASELIMNVFGSIGAKHVLVARPTFAEYARCANVHGASVHHVDYRADAKAYISAIEEHGIDMVVICRPNNPTGTMLDEAQLMMLIDYCHDRQIRVLLDECFYSLCDETTDVLGYASSITPSLLTDRPNLIVLRAFTKCFGMPGIRLGVAYCSDLELVDRISELLPTWNISQLAQLAAIEALKHPEYVASYRSLIAPRREELSRYLEANGCRVIPSSAGFIMFFSSRDLYTPLLSKGILIRDCSNLMECDEYVYRIAVRNQADNRVLMDALEEIFNG